MIRKGATTSEEFVVKIARHKTAAKGPSLVYMTKAQEIALTAYVKFYRPLAVACCSPDCYVFPSSTNQIEGCCSKLDFSALGKIIKRVATSAGVDAKLTSRILRRSQITALWESNSDPAWRSKVADQCSHSLDTARRYYEYSSKVNPCMEVVSELKMIREITACGLETEEDVDEPSLPLK